ncbi:MAG: hypothetical protein SVR81_11015 [Chloroflexota bacterium]|nr:hypothetical protein [Chloroflexota bacterium]
MKVTLLNGNPNASDFAVDDYLSTLGRSGRPPGIRSACSRCETWKLGMILLIVSGETLISYSA